MPTIARIAIWLTTFIVLLCALAHPAVFAQERFSLQPERRTEASEAFGEAGERGGEDEIETDRDSFTPATGVVGKKRLVVESAYTFIDHRDVPETHSLPEIVARYGITDNMELRLGYNYEVGGAGNSVSGKCLSARDGRCTLSTSVWLPLAASLRAGSIFSALAYTICSRRILNWGFAWVGGSTTKLPISLIISVAASAFSPLI